tara:strand:+ start:15294 stop:15689 length:396 start_codon:yes stop_codon:yes gene_type:complete
MFILLKNNLVVQKQPNMAEGFVWTDKDVVCGQVEKDGVFSNPKPKALTPKQKSDALKLSGVRFEGVLCSAEAEDMWGLSSLKEFIKSGNSTLFVFNNGNTLLLTPDNLSAFEAVWIPFRSGFFKSEVANDV